MAFDFKIGTAKGVLDLSSAKVMGILNITPDSFSDGGNFLAARNAIRRAWEIAEEGADILDIGAESSRPGAAAVEESVERERLWPVLKELSVENYPIPISLDTTKPSLAVAAWKEGFFQILNDIEGLRNPDMVDLVRDEKIPAILMHMFGTPRTMQENFQYEDVVTDLIGFFKNRLKETGLSDRQNIVLDPGIGFGKSVRHNLEIISRLSEFLELGYPVLIGASRKSFLGKILGLQRTEDRLEASLAAAAISVYNGAHIVRVHDVAETVKAVRIAQTLKNPGFDGF